MARQSEHDGMAPSSSSTAARHRRDDRRGPASSAAPASALSPGGGAPVLLRDGGEVGVGAARRRWWRTRGRGGDWSATRRGSSSAVARFPRATAAVAANPGAGARAGIAQRRRCPRAGSAWWRRASGPGAGAGNALLERRLRQCIRGERERIFSSPLSSDAKCLLGMHDLLDTNLVMHNVLGDA